MALNPAALQTMYDTLVYLRDEIETSNRPALGRIKAAIKAADGK